MFQHAESGGFVHYVQVLQQDEDVNYIASSSKFRMHLHPKKLAAHRFLERSVDALFFHQYG